MQGIVGASLCKQYAKDYNCACAVRIHACPFALLVEVSKLAWRLVRSKVAVCLLCLKNDKGSVVHYSHRNDLVIETLQFLARRDSLSSGVSLAISCWRRALSLSLRPLLSSLLSSASALSFSPTLKPDFPPFSCFSITYRSTIHSFIEL